MRLFTFIAVLFFGIVASAQTVDDFVFEIYMFSSTTTYSFEITTSSTVTVDWGDGTIDNYSNVTDQLISHNYLSQNNYTVIINNQLDSFKFPLNISLTINQWGTTTWQTMFEAFKGCTDLFFASTDLPDLSQVTDMSYMFANTGTFNSDISNWDVSNVINMNSIFYEARTFNQPLDNWNVSSVTNMSNMFLRASNFNSDISNWDVSSVTDMSNMFQLTNRFNQPLNSWNVSNVINMSSMFADSNFNQPLNNWNVSSVTDMSYMFKNGDRFFNPDVSNWDVSNVTNMSEMFYELLSFNQPLNNWDVSSVTDMSGMFSRSLSAFFNPLFNQPLNNWNVSSVTDMSRMFSLANNFNQSISNWDVSNVTNMNRMFSQAYNFNQPLNSWDVSNVTDMEGMFSAANSFNQPLNNWNVSSVTDMSGMFGGASNFNQSLDDWDISAVTTIIFMFDGAINFNQDLSSWNFNANVAGSSFIGNSGLDVYNYDVLLQRYVQLNLSSNTIRDCYVTGLEYCDSFSREILIQNGWNITGDTLSSTCSDATLLGNLQFDMNNNGCDISDPYLNNIALEVNDGTNTVVAYTNINGQYVINLPDGTYTITPFIDPAIFAATPSTANITITSGTSVTQDFCVTATALVDDLEITILPLEDARPGFDTDYKLIYKNKGNTRLSGSVNFTYQDDFMDFLNSNPATTSSSIGVLSWDFIDLDPFETREIEFTMNLNTPTDPTFPLNSNDLLDISATINPTANDDTPLDNVFDLQQTVVNSYDPNDKTCLQGETILPTMVGEYVHYRIRFENEGTASAVNVRIIDYIDTSKFDITSLTPLSASHDYTTTITEGNKVEFLFENIMLPFTAPASQGYVLFKIKTVNTLVLGDDFSNQAEIYFDFNFPIITNLETTSVDTTASLNDNNFLEVSLYPNPAKNTVSLTSNLELSEYTIYDTLGAVVSQEKLEVATLIREIQVNHLVSGLYFVEVKSDQMSSVLKLIKE